MVEPTIRTTTKNQPKVALEKNVNGFHGVLADFVFTRSMRLEADRVEQRPKPNPEHDDSHPDRDRFPGELQPQFGDEPAKLPEHPSRDDRLDQVNPVARRSLETALEEGEQDENDERRGANKNRTLFQLGYG